jgi:hypothetical protein
MDSPQMTTHCNCHEILTLPLRFCCKLALDTLRK